jgi:hypothetical protein
MPCAGNAQSRDAILSCHGSWITNSTFSCNGKEYVMENRQFGQLNHGTLEA